MKAELFNELQTYGNKIETEGVAIIQAAYLLRVGNVNQAKEVIEAAIEELKLIVKVTEDAVRKAEGR